ncbi:PREDICTED: DEAD-box ATP-dependent RNA helicase 28-like [Nelumbo nucifera]|uniref:DEAD-box ATP-dependent RNA helicase 28-like n=1 Tax=Nelumbo nucifera TaxID=4432 RepID=A0A1U7ZGW6_NELNU|nr:PREDICTED: DEAD-box ATP-dependent RNA helicase 28-like [Nelumbo nucifera]
MDANFVFEAPSDRELENEEEEESETQKSQSPWEFSAYSESVAEEHARRSTTSIDFKISRAREECSIPLLNHSDDNSTESEPDKQENYKPKEGDDNKNVRDSKSFFAPSDGAQRSWRFVM